MPAAQMKVYEISNGTLLKSIVNIPTGTAYYQTNGHCVGAGLCIKHPYEQKSNNN